MFNGVRAMGLVVSRETQHMGVPYYVDKSFEKEYRGSALGELEKTIESDYIEHLQNSCWKEKQQSKRAAHPPLTESLHKHTNLCCIQYSFWKICMCGNLLSDGEQADKNDAALIYVG